MATIMAATTRVDFSIVFASLAAAIAPLQFLGLGHRFSGKELNCG
jgi:hypothetical protein